MTQSYLEPFWDDLISKTNISEGLGDTYNVYHMKPTLDKLAQNYIQAIYAFYNLLANLNKTWRQNVNIHHIELCKLPYFRE